MAGLPSPWIRQCQLFISNWTSLWKKRHSIGSVHDYCRSIKQAGHRLVILEPYWRRHRKLIFGRTTGLVFTSTILNLYVTSCLDNLRASYPSRWSYEHLALMSISLRIILPHNLRSSNLILVGELPALRKKKYSERMVLFIPVKLFQKYDKFWSDMFCSNHRWRIVKWLWVSTYGGSSGPF